MGVRWAIPAIVGLLLSACGIGEAGTGLARQLDGEEYPGVRIELTGVVDGGPACWEITLDRGTYFVIWPAGSEDVAVDDEWGVGLPQGETIAPGSIVTGTGAFTRTGPLVADQNGYWAHVIGMCAPDATEVVVFDAAQRGS